MQCGALYSQILEQKEDTDRRTGKIHKIWNLDCD